jgi:hypothetical protein
MDQPTDESDYTVKWDGEWQITLMFPWFRYRVFGSHRDYLYVDCRLVPEL